MLLSTTQNQLDRLKVVGGVAAGLFAVDLSISPSLWSVGLLFVVAISAVIYFMPVRQWGRLRRLNRRYRFARLATLACFTVVALHSLTDPASAQFYQNAQDWLDGELTANLTGAQDATAVTNMLGLSFNVLRALFLLYIGISIVKIVNAARQDEDWQNLSRTPLIVVIAVTAGDVLSGLIVGTGGG